MDSLQSVFPTSEVPTPRTPLIGRDHEVESVCSLLASPDVPLVTLTGPGGVGKTRLAQHIAAQSASVFPDGSLLISLAPLRDPALLLSAIGQSIGLSTGSQHQLAHQIRSALTGRAVLLVLDNFEHIMSAARTIADLLAHVPDLTILITSRSPLRIGVEREFSVVPLALPIATAAENPYDYLSSPAVRLFVERARAVARDFIMSESDAATVAHICRRLDALPLAIELVAAHAKVLSPVEILRRLEQRLPLTPPGRRDLPARQQTMTTTIAWSYDLLSPAERDCFEQLSVFTGGFSLDAAEAVTVLSHPGQTILDIVSSLIDQSLLHSASMSGGATRYMMLETIREFAEQCLIDRGVADCLRDRFADWCISFVHDVVTAIAPTVQPGGLEQIEIEKANIRATLDWLIANGRGEGATQLLGDLDWYWYLDGSIDEGFNWLLQALQLDPGDAPDRALCSVYLNAGHLVSELGHPDSIAWLEHSRALARRANDTLYEGRATYTLGAIAADTGNYAAAEEFLTEARSLFRQLPHEWLELLATYQLGIVAVGQRNHPRAISLLDAVRGAAGRMEDAILPVWCLHYLGLVAFDEGHHEQVADIVRQLFAWCVKSPSVRHHYWDQLAAAAILAASSENATAIARLLGALATESLGVEHRLPERDYFARFEAIARRCLDSETYDREFQTGRRMSRAQLALVLDDVLAACDAAPSVKRPGPWTAPFLTRRERDVLDLMVAGHTNRQIADTLFISHRTVSTHVTNILTKFNVYNRAAAVSYAFQHDLLSDGSAPPSR